MNESRLTKMSIIGVKLRKSSTPAAHDLKTQKRPSIDECHPVFIKAARSGNRKEKQDER
jgi:hypothetical protein